ITSCQHEGIPADQLDPVCFNQQVLPIFQNSCAISGCHSAQDGESGYVFTDYSNIMRAVSPGNSSKSKAYKVLSSSLQLMPPHNPLPMDKRTLIRVWIDQGAKETDCTTQANTPQLNNPVKE
ncbi:MAG: c-type cytochrome domain-containing protein, partial [Bacteroidales bacterium]